MAPRRPTEEEFGRKWDRCFVDTTFKTVGGAVFGGILSLLFFKRSAWPVTLGIGIGIGAGYSNCRHQFRGPHGPPFGRPLMDRPFWARRDGVKGIPCKPSRPEEPTPVPAQSHESKEPKHEEKPSES
ncbi:MICOS complex subunit MIC10 [Desmophyllum pertusum]|uniref:MICOS complex subunit MIC10 n=1 Tax=Desmophyllum pertusum TaxID=174260 RepID=A0A9X0A4L8_9CNID|nr:MICOS complex subunit MIC10 [Desmophyllum pertusum]